MGFTILLATLGVDRGWTASGQGGQSGQFWVVLRVLWVVERGKSGDFGVKTWFLATLSTPWPQ